MSTNDTLFTRITHLLQWRWGKPLPIVLQTEITECGLACLTMIGQYYGHNIDLFSMRQRYEVSLKGTPLKRMITLADQLSFDSRPIKLELENLSKLKPPCILHWDLNHFVVLKKVSGTKAVIHDPARGERKLPLKEISDHFTGVALEIYPKINFAPIQKERQKISWKNLIGRIHGLWKALGQILLLAVALEVFSLTTPFYMQWVLDQALVSADHDLLTLLGIGFILIAIFHVMVGAVRSWSVLALNTSMNIQWTNNVFGHMIRLPLSWFEKRYIGDIVSRFSSLHTIKNTITTKFISSLLDGTMSFVTLIIMGLYSLKLMSLVFIFFIAYALLRWIFYKPLRHYQEELIVLEANQQTELLESIRGSMTIKLANQQEERQKRYTNKLVDTMNKNTHLQKLLITFHTIHDLIFGVGRIALIWTAALMILDKQMTTGMLVAFIAYADLFITRVTGLVDQLIEFRMLSLHAERLADIVLNQPEVSAVASSAEPEDYSFEIEHVYFRYNDEEPWIIEDFSCQIPAGESVVIAGPSGCGKTTLIKLILGLLKPTTGTILCGGTSIHRQNLNSYRDQIGTVMQDDQLFAGSIAENISFFALHSDMVQIIQAAKSAAIHEDILAMPMGYQTLVGDMGSSLSGGQKQRIILARALYKNPKVLILDEATSHLNFELENKIHKIIDTLDITRIIISHEESMINRVDNVIFLDRSHNRINAGETQATTSAINA
jgi:ATP-binding cassette subfamily B protein RaxB